MLHPLNPDRLVTYRLDRVLGIGGMATVYAASRGRWGNVLTRLIPDFGRLRVDELRTADVVAWRDQVARWIRDGMPSTRKRDEGKHKIVKLSPVTANGWLSILKVICAAMTKHYAAPASPATSAPTSTTASCPRLASCAAR